MVSKPSYDPNTLSVHSTVAVLHGVQRPHEVEQPSRSPTAPSPATSTTRGRCSSHWSPPPRIDSGKATADTAFPNPAALQLPLSTTFIHNSGGGTCGPGATATIATAIRLSCNIPMAQLGASIGEATISEYASRFGFGKPLALANGNFAVTPSIYPTGQDAPHLMLSSFGQSDDRVTPLQIALDSAAIANGGVEMQPTLIKKVIQPDLSELDDVLSPKVYSTPISATTAAAVRDMMVSSVADGAASNARIEGVLVAGKTGTAQNGVHRSLHAVVHGIRPGRRPAGCCCGGRRERRRQRCRTLWATRSPHQSARQ